MLTLAGCGGPDTSTQAPAEDYVVHLNVPVKPARLHAKTVVADGADVGHVTGVKARDGGSVLTLGLQRSSAPLAVDARATVCGERVLLDPGRQELPSIPSDGVLPVTQVTTHPDGGSGPISRFRLVVPRSQAMTASLAIVARGGGRIGRVADTSAVANGGRGEASAQVTFEPALALPVDSRFALRGGTIVVTLGRSACTFGPDEFQVVPPSPG